MNLQRTGHLVLLFSLLAATPVAVAQGETEVIDLDRAVELALENNREIRISEYDLDTSESGYQEAIGAFFPEVSISGQYTRNVKKPVIFLGDGMNFPGGGGGSGSIEVGSNNSYQAGVNATLPIYSRQLTLARETAARSRDLSRVNLRDTRNSVIADVKRAFHTIMMSEELLRVTRQRVENAKKQLETAHSQHERGLATEYDLLVAEVQLENLKPELIQMEDDLKTSVLQFKNILGITDWGNIRIEGELEPTQVYTFSEDRDRLYESLKTGNTQLQLLNRQIQLAETSIDMERASLHPTLSAFGNYQLLTESDTYQFGDYDWVKTAAVGLSVQIPLFAGNSRRERITQAEIARRQVDEQKRAAEESLQTELATVTNRLEQISRRIKAADRAQIQSQRAYELSRLRFEQGVGTQLEINDAELSYANSQLNSLQAYFDYQLAMITLEQLQGELAGTK
ncbi:MAG: TolC family protein [Balneolaceae bacterium]